MITLSDIIKTIPHSPTLWANELVWNKRQKGETVYHMGFGESPFPVPERLQQALSNATHHKAYLRAAGLAALGEVVREYYRPLVGDAYVDGCDVIVAPGSKLILYSLQLAIAGDILLPVPSWVSYAPQARLIGSEVIQVKTSLDNVGYHIAPDDLQIAIDNARKEGKKPTKIILNSPNNPTGLVIPNEELQAIAEVCSKNNIFIISDEIYGQVAFNENYESIAPLAPSSTAISSGLSKHLSLGGWRLGIGFIPKAVKGLHDALCRLVSETWSSVSTPIQYAALEAYKNHEDISQHIVDCTAIHRLMNQYISQGLKEAGISCPLAQGAFYNYPDFDTHRKLFEDKHIRTSEDLHQYLLKEHALATLPGHVFGEQPEKLTLRLSGCDYDGEKALQAYQSGATLDESFIVQYAPHIIKQVALLDDLINK